MNVLWSPEALEDLASLQAYIGLENPVAARRIGTRLIDIVENILADNPQMGRPGRVPGTRELVVPRTPYIIPYRIIRDVVEVIGIYHGAQRWPDSF